ncbi:bone morphogenetic protein receptor type-2 [Nephila pilipes]|uniref:receptor protein serine/threonine kinase n=1 Tax=Nephila pilipes TaxID=299642 RepID=A0A8X6NQJ8_NEPPI|nr:bone morphogenetic protein receptor type-2 [Nephila pilipes]
MSKVQDLLGKSHDDSHPLCFYLKTPIIKQINVTVGSLLDGNTTERCSKPTDSCYILWQEDPRNKSITIISQGCWNDANQKCQQSECIPSRSTKALDNTHFCCCEGNFCNTNITDAKISPDCCVDDPAQHFLEHIPYHKSIIIVLCIVVGIAVFAVYFLHRTYCTLPKRSNESLHLMEAPPPSSPNFDLDTLKLQESVARGRYGSVYRGSLNDQSVAVKKFVCQDQQHFLNERAIYLLPHMNHACLPKFIGSKEQISDDGRPEYLLVVSFSPLGCLQDYLQENTVDWNSLCKMILSVSCGLAHLHSEVRKGDKFKPCVVHRDVTSRNILVKSDGTCMLCDFGFAIQISGSTYVLNGEEVKAEETSLADVGTLRYMAPEILEGAVNLRDCESSLKQTDVYALGLVMWEVSSRCLDLYQGLEVPPYKLPYEAEVGTDPTMEQMQTLVAKHKSRPLFPDIWKTTNPAVRSLKETIEDCWDQDAEARLTTLCVEERISELPVLWERDKAGLNVISGINPSLNPVSNICKSSSFHNKSSNDSDFGSEIIDDRLITPRERANSLSECTTETLLSPSDAVSQANDKNKLLSNEAALTKVTYPLQPYQGRNPCLARNLMKELPHETRVIGNSLDNYPLKYPLNEKMISFSDGDANIFSLPPGMKSNLISRDFNNHSNRVRNPIPFVQNHVNFSSTIPSKQLNLTEKKKTQEFLLKNEKRWNPLHIFDKKTTKSGIRASLRMLLDRKTSISNGNIPEEQQPLKSSSISSPISPSECSDKQGQINPNAFWTSPDPKEGEQDSYGTLCTSNLSTVDGNAVMKSYDHHLLKGHAISVNEESSLPVSISCLDSTPGEKTKRPTTLPVRSLNDKQDVEQVILDMSDCDISNELVSDFVPNPDSVEAKPSLVRRKGSGGKKKGVKRVKTPFEIKCRFSLYDDRIMSSQELPTACIRNDPQSHLDKAKFSASVPLNMNTLCLSPAVTMNQQTEVKIEPEPKEKRVNGLVLPVNHVGPQNVISLCDI